MLLGVKSKKEVFYRHLAVGIVSVSLIYLVWLINATWSPDMRLWKAFGGAAFILLWLTVFIGPISKLWQPLTRLSTWRREIGIWFAIVASIHTYLILDGWVRWGFLEFFGYKYIPELETYLRSEPGFGLANMMGLVAVTFAIILAATSFDRVVSFLGISSWKWLQSFTYVIFYLIVLHAVYFAFIHYTPSPERVLMGMNTNYPANALQFYYLGALISVFVVQVTAFIKSVVQQRRFRKS